VTVLHAFDEFCLCTQRRVLFREEEEVRLRRKAYECLRYLIEQSPRAVPKDELCDVVWSPRIISNETLTSTINDVRRALDDREQPRRYVRTLSGFGYRFVADVTTGS
jgi:DNA-binding winged helix-turn-helix (wHTH) protein